MNSLPKWALLREETAPPLLSRDPGVSHHGGHPHSSSVALRTSVLPVLWATTLGHPLSYREVPCANSVLGGGFWEVASSLQHCKRPRSLQYSSAIGSRINRNNQVQILLLDNVEFSPSLYLTGDTGGVYPLSHTTDRDHGRVPAEADYICIYMSATAWKL